MSTSAKYKTHYYSKKQHIQNPWVNRNIFKSSQLPPTYSSALLLYSYQYLEYYIIIIIDCYSAVIHPYVQHLEPCAECSSTLCMRIIAAALAVLVPAPLLLPILYKPWPPPLATMSRSLEFRLRSSMCESN
jgi:hypothetical protein